MKLEQKLFGTEDLENLSTIVMYGFDPSQPFKDDMGGMSSIRISSFSSQFSYLDEGTKPKENYFERYRKEQEELNIAMIKQQEERREEERQKRIEETDRSLRESILHVPSKPLSGNGDLYFRDIPSLNDQLHVHPSTGFAKLKKSGEWLSNYMAAMLDLKGENEGGKSGGDEW